MRRYGLIVELPEPSDDGYFSYAAVEVKGAHMTSLVDSGLLTDLKRFGAADVSACFSCGNCTAICPLSSNDGTFPRRIIRYAQVGHEGRAALQQGALDVLPLRSLLGDMPAAGRPRRVHGVGSALRHRELRSDPARSHAVHAIRCSASESWCWSRRSSRSSCPPRYGPQSATSLALFGFIPENLIHMTGVVVMILAGVAGLAGIVDDGTWHRPTGRSHAAFGLRRTGRRSPGR